jgi:hypothetical protein
MILRAMEGSDGRDDTSFRSDDNGLVAAVCIDCSDRSFPVFCLSIKIYPDYIIIRSLTVKTLRGRYAYLFIFFAHVIIFLYNGTITAQE